jgi:hypothetical protein
MGSRLPWMYRWCEYTYIIYVGIHHTPKGRSVNIIYHQTFFSFLYKNAHLFLQPIELLFLFNLTSHNFFITLQRAASAFEKRNHQRIRMCLYLRKIKIPQGAVRTVPYSKTSTTVPNTTSLSLWIKH